MKIQWLLRENKVLLSGKVKDIKTLLVNSDQRNIICVAEFLLRGMLTEKEIQNLKEQLEKEAGELELKIKSKGKMTDFGSDVESDFSEEADEAEELSEKIGEKEAYKEQLADIELALDKIIRGKYGVCEKCGGEISLEVLKISPESRLCRACKAI